MNKRRKLRHQEVGEQLRAAEDEWMSLLRKNREIETACNLADNQAQELQRTLDRYPPPLPPREGGLVCDILVPLMESASGGIAASALQICLWQLTGRWQT